MKNLFGSLRSRGAFRARRQAVLLISIGLAASSSFAAAPSNVSVQSTPQQAVLEFDIKNPAQCAVAVYADAGRTRLVNDSDTAIDPNAQACSRGLPGSIVKDGHVQFIVGQRTSKKSAADGKLYSLSLQTAATYYYTITNTADSTTFQDKFDTPTLPLGNMFPELPPFDSTGTSWSNDAYPTFAYGDSSKQYIDPLWGTLVSLIPSQRKDMDTYSNLLAGPAVDITGGKWSNLGNCGGNGQGAENCVSSGGAANLLFLPLGNFRSRNGNTLSGWVPDNTIDDVRVRVYCGSTTSPQTLRVWLTRDSGQTLSGQHYDVSCPVGSPPVIFNETAFVPQHNPAGYFVNWQPFKPMRDEIVLASGQVTVTGGVNVATTSSDAYIPPTISPNSLINISGNYYKIASIVDGSHLTLATAAPNGAGQSFHIASFGIAVANITGTQPITLSIGADVTEVFQPQMGFTGIVPPCSGASRQFTTDAAGNAIPPTTGYLCGDEETNIYWYIPKNADGTWRLEMRPAGVNYVDAGRFPAQFTTNGDPLLNGSGYPINGVSGGLIGFDQSDPLKYYFAQNLGSLRLFSVAWDTTISADCAAFKGYVYGPEGGYSGYPDPGPSMGCWHWTNLTPVNSTPSKEPNAQVRAAWATGLNSAGQQVGPAHPEMNDISWMPVLPNAMDNGAGVRGGLLCEVGTLSQNSMAITMCFDPVTGLLKSLTDTWSTWPARWGGAHSFTTPPGNFTMAGLENIVGSSGAPFQSEHDALVTKVNRAGAGLPPIWDTNTAIGPNEAYACPTVTDPKIFNYFGQIGGQVNCVQVEVNSMACNHTPSTGLIFAGGTKNEATAFPCSTPGFGVPPGASGWSKLQNFIVGDWVTDFQATNLGFPKSGGEVRVISQININSANSIDIWLYRKADQILIQPLLPASDYGRCNSGGSGNLPNPNNSYNGWSMSMSLPFSCVGGLGSPTYNVNDPTATWIPGNGWVTGQHGTEGIGPTPGKWSYVVGAFNNTSVALDQTDISGLTKFTNGPSLYPSFHNGRFANYNFQSYPALTQTKATGKDLTWALDTHAIAPGFGAGPEIPNGCIANNAMTMVLQSGTTQTYLINDASSGQPIDLKNTQQMKYAGRYNLKDYSGAATGNVFGDAQNFGVCYAYKSNECRTGSTAGNIYVSVPAADNGQGCPLSDQNARNAPVFANVNPETAAIVNFDYTKKDFIGLNERKLSMMLRGPGRQYQFNHAWAMADGQAIMYRADWVDGIWDGLVLMAMPPFPGNDSTHRMNFVSYPIDLSAGKPGATKARARFGYAENGPAGSFFCTSRQEACSTEGDGSFANPFAYVTSDTRTLLDCSGRCTVTIPAIGGRTLYYVIDRLSDNGATVVSTSPLTAVPIQ